MSWLSDNYEKAALSGAAVVALALGAVVISNKDAVEESFNRESVTPDNDVSVPGFVKIAFVRDSLSQTHIIPRPNVDGREVELLTGVPLFAKRDDIANPVDLLKSPAVHQRIPNEWWLKHELDPGFSDSPELDPDNDGFSNREEFVARTDPNEFKSHPDPIAKLAAVSVTTTTVRIKPSGFGEGLFKFKLLTRRGADRNKMDNPIGKGANIEFKSPLMQKRFKFDSFVDEEVEKHGAKQLERFWIIEDLKPNKVGQKYRFDRQGMRVDPGAPVGVVDHTVEFTLQALKQGGSPFKIEENIRFSLPFDEKAKKKPYLLKKVDENAKTIEIEYLDVDGKTQTHQLSYAK